MKRHIPFDGEDVIALVLLNRLFERFFGLMAGRSHDRVVVVERHHREDHVLGDRRVGTNEGFGAAGAFKAVEPHDGRARLRLHRFGNFLRAGAAEAEARGSERAELQEASTADALTAKCFVLGFKHVAGLPLLSEVFLRRFPAFSRRRRP